MLEETTPEAVTIEAPVTVDPAPSEDVQPVVEKSFTQKELDDILEKRLGKERRKREELQRRLTVTEELVLKGKPAEVAQRQPTDDAPKREQYEDYESYLEARAEYRADKKVEERFSRERENQRTTQEEASKRTVMERFQQAVREESKTIDDFEDVLSSSEAPMTKAMSDAIVHSDIGPKLAYHLAKNPDEAERIAALPAARQAVEIGRLEGKLSDSTESPKSTKTPSRAPEPIKPVSGKSGVVDAEPSHDRPDEWRKWREKQRQARRG